MSLSRRPKVLVTRRLPQLFDAELNADDRPLNQQELAAAVSDADVLVPTVTDRIDAGVLPGAGSRLRLIANFGVGTNHIDLSAARAQGIVVTNTPGVLTEDTADMAMALILAVSRRLSEGEARLRRGDWSGWAPTDFLGRSLSGKGLGIVGMGRIGQALARRARASGLSIHYHNRHRLPEPVERELEANYWPELDGMLRAVDIVTIHCPATAETRNLIDERRLHLMKALECGAIAGAGLDVYVAEPRVDPRLRSLGNVVLLPHMGSATLEARTAMGDKVIANIAAWTRGETPPDRC